MANTDNTSSLEASFSYPKFYSSQYATQCVESAPVAEKASDSDIDLFASDDDDAPAKVYRFALLGDSFILDWCFLRN